MPIGPGCGCGCASGPAPCTFNLCVKVACGWAEPGQIPYPAFGQGGHDVEVKDATDAVVASGTTVDGLSGLCLPVTGVKPFVVTATRAGWKTATATIQTGAGPFCSAVNLGLRTYTEESSVEVRLSGCGCELPGGVTATLSGAFSGSAGFDACSRSTGPIAIPTPAPTAEATTVTISGLPPYYEPIAPFPEWPGACGPREVTITPALAAGYTCCGSRPMRTTWTLADQYGTVTLSPTGPCRWQGNYTLDSDCIATRGGIIGDPFRCGDFTPGPWQIGYTLTLESVVAYSGCDGDCPSVLRFRLERNYGLCCGGQPHWGRVNSTALGSIIVTGSTTFDVPVDSTGMTPISFPFAMDSGPWLCNDVRDPVGFISEA